MDKFETPLTENIIELFFYPSDMSSLKIIKSDSTSLKNYEDVINDLSINAKANFNSDKLDKSIIDKLNSIFKKINSIDFIKD